LTSDATDAVDRNAKIATRKVLILFLGFNLPQNRLQCRGPVPWQRFGVSASSEREILTIDPLQTIRRNPAQSSRFPDM
jgi:hypothetical protein